MTFNSALLECWEAMEAQDEATLFRHTSMLREKLHEARKHPCARSMDVPQLNACRQALDDSMAADNAMAAGLKAACVKLLVEVQHNLECLVMWEDDAHGVRTGTKLMWDRETLNEWEHRNLEEQRDMQP